MRYTQHMRAFIQTRKPYLAAHQRKPNSAFFLALVVFCIHFSTFGAAQEVARQSKAEINAQLLLQRLSEAGPEDATRIARQIKRNWARSGSASTDLLLKRGNDALKAKKPRIALEHLTALTDHAPNFAEGWHTRASAFYQQDMYGPAVADLEQALRLNPFHFDAIQGLGAVFEQLGDHEGAYEAYKQVIAIHPHHTAVLEAMERLEDKVRGPAL